MGVAVGWGLVWDRPWSPPGHPGHGQCDDVHCAPPFMLKFVEKESQSAQRKAPRKPVLAALTIDVAQELRFGPEA